MIDSTRELKKEFTTLSFLWGEPVSPSLSLSLSLALSLSLPLALSLHQPFSERRSSRSSLSSGASRYFPDTTLCET